MSTGGFRFEREMLRPATFALRGILRVQPGTITLVEPSVCNFIPDLLLCRFIGGIALESARRITNLEATLLAAIDVAGECTQMELHSKVFITEQRALVALARLEKIRRIERTTYGAYRLTPGTSCESVELIAVEFKLRRWIEALAQAIRYKEFADRSYVVVDGTQVDSSQRIIETFSSHGRKAIRSGDSRIRIAQTRRAARLA